jgi:hypothetical protein
MNIWNITKYKVTAFINDKEVLTQVFSNEMSAEFYRAGLYGGLLLGDHPIVKVDIDQVDEDGRKIEQGA